MTAAPVTRLLRSNAVLGILCVAVLAGVANVVIALVVGRDGIAVLVKAGQLVAILFTLGCCLQERRRRPTPQPDTSPTHDPHAETGTP